MASLLLGAFLHSYEKAVLLNHSLSVCLPGSSEDALNNATSLMDLKVGWRFTKGQHVSEIQETIFSERGGLRLCQMSLVLALWCGRAFIF